MTLPISLDQLKLALNFLPLDPEVKKSLIINSEILIEFRGFLSQKYNISESEAETKIKDYMSQNFNSSNLNEVIDVAHNYALNEGFSKSEEFKLAISELVQLKDKLSGK